MGGGGWLMKQRSAVAASEDDFLRQKSLAKAEASAYVRLLIKSEFIRRRQQPLNFWHVETNERSVRTGA